MCNRCSPYTDGELDKDELQHAKVCGQVIPANAITCELEPQSAPSLDAPVDPCGFKHCDHKQEPRRNKIHADALQYCTFQQYFTQISVRLRA